MFPIFIKHFFVIYCSLYGAAKIVNIKKNHYLFFILNFIYSSLTGILYIHLSVQLKLLYMPMVILTMSIFLKLMFRIAFQTTFTITTISYAISNASFLLADIIISIPIVILDTYFLSGIMKNDSLQYLLMTLLHITIIFFLYRTKRLKKGMPFLLTKRNGLLGLYISFITILSGVLITLKKMSLVSVLLIIIILLCFHAIYIWWQHQIQMMYMNRMTIRELEFLNKEITSLKTDNEILSALVHKDNKIIPSLIMAVKDYISAYENSSSDKIDTALGNDIIKNLETLLLERQNTIHSCVTLDIPVIKTNIISIDALMNYMVQKAKQANITVQFEYHFSNTCCNFLEMLSNCISENELCTLLADMIDNAIIATSCNHRSDIMVNIFSDLENRYTIEVSDSGIPFEAEVIVNFGRKRITTHKDFGTGIGLNTIYHIASTHNASIVIDETITNDRYTKKMLIVFDNKHSYILKTNSRADELHYLSSRIDLQIEK